MIEGVKIDPDALLIKKATEKLDWWLPSVAMHTFTA
jgi:hypothetical protein